MQPSVIPSDHQRKIDELIKAIRGNSGLAPVDIERFWADQQAAGADPFGNNIPQVPLGIMMSGECVYDELGIPVDFRRYATDEQWRLELNKAYNDKAEKIVGKRLLNEKPGPTAGNRYPPVKGLAEVFEAETIWLDQSWWLQQSARNEDELAALLDRVEGRLGSLREFILPPNWSEEKDRLQKLGVKPQLYRWQRGPVTFATSIYGVENTIFLIVDNPDLAKRFSELILAVILEVAQVLDEEAGYTPETAPRGWGWADDNCALLTPEMYELFAYPILKGIFERYSPDPADRRFQHSDSAMEHIVPLLGKLNVNGVNFGPTVSISEIRQHLPNATIYGELAPFTFSRNKEEKIVAEFLRDFDMAKASRGLVFATAGSINNGSRLTGMRLIMAAIQKYGRY